MANRHLSRSVVLQTLFEWDFRKLPEVEIRHVFERNVEEFAPGMGADVFMTTLLNGVLAKRADLDDIISKAAPDWPVEKISVVDRNILRVGLYELLFADRSQVPPKVAINEAIELAKTFGSDTSGKFVNGVLGAVYKEIGEPGKDEQSKPKKNSAGPVPVERLVGAVVYAKEDDEIYLALVHDVFGHWTLSKGHLEAGEDESKGLVRVVKEELGIKVKVKEALGENEYGTYDPEKGKIKKRVSYYLAESDFVDLKLKDSGGLDDVKWFKIKAIIDLNFYDDILPIVTKAINILIKT